MWVRITFLLFIVYSFENLNNDCWRTTNQSQTNLDDEHYLITKITNRYSTLTYTSPDINIKLIPNSTITLRFWTTRTKEIHGHFLPVQASPPLCFILLHSLWRVSISWLEFPPPLTLRAPISVFSKMSKFELTNTYIVGFKLVLFRKLSFEKSRQISDCAHGFSL